MKSKSVLDELLKVEADMYKGDPSGEMTDQYLDAGQLMITFFKLGIEMADMNQVKSEGLNTQLNILFKNYGINLDTNF
jgi:flagellar motor protein MotB